MWGFFLIPPLIRLPKTVSTDELSARTLAASDVLFQQEALKQKKTIRKEKQKKKNEQRKRGEKGQTKKKHVCLVGWIVQNNRW